MSKDSGRIQRLRLLNNAPALSAMRVLMILSAAFLAWSAVRLEPWSTYRRDVDAASSDIPWTEVNPIGVNTFLSKEVEPWKRERTLEMAAEAGVGWIKQHVPWRDIETQPDSYWDANFQQDTWAKYDAIVDSAERHGLRLIARIDLAPQWARPAGSSHTAPPSNFDDFGDFIAEFVRHYQGRVQFIQVWNEPNLAEEWGGTIDPEGYAQLLRVAADAARSVDPNVVILSAPMAMTTENSERAMDDLSYWRSLYAAGAAPYFDIMSANAYGLDRPYDATPDPAVLNIRRIELLHEVAANHGDGHKPIWLNEYGWNAAPEDFPPELLTWARVPEKRQAQWTVDGVDYLTSEHPWFGVANTWYFRQVGDISDGRPDYYFRAVDVEFTPRPLYRALQDLGDSLRHASPGLHNDLAPAIRPTGTWSIVKDPDAIQGQYTSGNAGSQMTIGVEANRVVAILAEDQRATGIVVSEVGGEGGRREVAIADSQREVTLASWPEDQAPQKRTISVEVTGAEPLLLDGIDVREHRSHRALIASGALLAITLICFGLVRRGTET